LPAIILVALALRLYALDSHGFFIDEIYSVQVARGSADPELMAFDSIRPLYFAFLKLWLTFSDNECWLRLPSVFFGTLNIGLTYWLGTLYAGRKAALAAAVLMALSPLEVLYSQQARMYTMGTSLALGGSLAITLALTTGRRLFIAAWLILRSLMIWTLPLTAVLIPVDIFFTLIKESKRYFAEGSNIELSQASAGLLKRLFDFRQILPNFLLALPVLATAALFFAWKMPLVAIANAYDAWRYTLPTPGPLDLLMVPVNFTSTALPLQECLGPLEGGYLSWLYSASILIMVALSLFTTPKKQLLPCLGWAFFPLLVAYAASLMGPCLLIIRYILFAAPYTFILIGTGFEKLLQKNRVLSATQIILYLSIITLNLTAMAANPVHEDWRAAMKVISANEQPSDKIVVWNYHASYLVSYYYKGKNSVYDLDIKDVAPDGNLKEAKLGARGLNKINGRTWFVMRKALKSLPQVWQTYQFIHLQLKKNYKILKQETVSKFDIFLITDLEQ
jgi:uncharacterized membrane protein